MARMEIEFQEAQACHAEVFLSFMEQVAQETDFIVLDESGLQVGLEDMELILQEFEASPQKLCLLACSGSEVIGAVTVQSSSQYPVSHIGSVFIAIKKDYWGHGLGTLLLEEVLHWAREMEVLHRLELTVQIRNQAAVHLYQKMGFRIEGTQRHGARTNEGEWLDLYYMGLLLDDI